MRDEQCTQGSVAKWRPKPALRYRFREVQDRRLRPPASSHLHLLGPTRAPNCVG